MLTTRIKHHEKIKAEIERERMRGNLLRAVSHDLRMPLTSIYGASSAVVENYDELDREHKIELMKGVQEVIVSIPEEFIVIPMDAMLIEQVLVNLLENAVDHAVGMEELRLEVSCSNGYAHFVVRDDGCGILPERMEQLFSDYLGRTDRPADGSSRNMGIGLSVCSAIVKAHGGEIRAQNLPQGGAAFTFALEMEESNE